nr:ATP-dependent RNA helicase A [Ipomoea batatas]
MEISVFSDAITALASTHTSKFLLNRHHGFTSNNVVSLSDDQQSLPSSASAFVQISAAFSPTDAVAPPPVRSNRTRTAPRRLARKTRRVRRKLLGGGGGEDDGGEFGFFFDGGDDDGAFGGGNSWGGGGGGGGSGWNFGGFGGSNWDEPSSNSISDPAFDFVYEVLSWIVFSNCLHFAFKKVVRIVAGGLGDPAREKVPMRLTPVC